MILEQLDVTPEELQARTGWVLKPEGLCKADRCVTLPDGRGPSGLTWKCLRSGWGWRWFTTQTMALWALGPESGGRALLSAEMPELTLPDRDGNPFSLSSLLGTKVLLLAWASW